VNTLYRDDLEDLIKHQDGLRVSVYMPTHRKGVETQQDPIRLKNLLTKVEERLQDEGLRRPEAREFIAPAEKLLADNLYWQHQSDGLALFMAPDSFRDYRFPFAFEELVVVADRYHIKPFLPLLSGDGRFYVLAISQDEVRLLQGTRYSVGEVDLDGVPQSLAEALRFDDPEKRLQFHKASGASTGHGSRPAMFYGQGGATQDEKVDILRYFQQVAAGVEEMLAGERVPLVLAGVGYLLPIYQEANAYRHLVEEGIEGNPQEMSARELHQRAWDILQPRFLRAQEEAAARYRELADKDHASGDLEQVVPAAHFGRVESLFVARDLEEWGTLDPQTGRVERHREPEPGDEDLLDLAAVQTLLQGGDVYAIDSDQVPGSGPVAATFRYP
jgi:hypothetical protein